ncbi:energy-coupling factor transporter transmembrane protein EcfT [Halobacteria archaeon AArc-dxtr1]|nr:energy-coupling factor transporter transmembrane protein EcfT [Halobacteria archaeon AArc-dxtr1]
MLRYEPGETLAHRLDPRSKLALQIGFTATALAHTSPPALVALTAFTLLVVTVAGVPLLRSLYAFRVAIVILAAAPVISVVTLGSPWIEPEAAVDPALASYRVVLILLFSAAYVRTTPVRDSRAAIQLTVPGKPGRVLGMGIALVFRFLPVLQADVSRIREAMAVRLGSERGFVDRASHIGILALAKTFDRADRLSMALQARCFAWNPTLPRLAFSRRDVPVLAMAAVLAATAVVW